MDTGGSAKDFPKHDLVQLAESGRWVDAEGKSSPLDAPARAFLEQVGRDADAEEYAGLSPAALLSAINGLWTWSGAAAAGAQVVRVRAAAGRMVLDVAGPDMPFLVDSVMGEVAEQGLSTHALFHPIVDRGRGPESLIQVHLGDLAPARADALANGVRATLADVRAAVDDFEALKARMHACRTELAASLGVETEERHEALAFLDWLLSGAFTFLGARDYAFARDAAGEFVQDEPIILEKTGLGILRAPERYVLRRGSEPAIVTREIRRFLEEPSPIVVAKSSYASRVHRRAPADYIGVKRYDAMGGVVGETRFVGLFTSDAYNEMTRDIPVLRKKTARVVARAGFAPGSHNARILQNIVETYPRDELFQIGEDDLYRVSTEILTLSARPRPRVFVRRDRFNRFVVALAYLPKDRFNSALREAVGARLVEAYGGQVAAFYPELGDGPLARIRFIIQDIDRDRPDPDMAALERDVAALTRSWEDDLDAALRTAGLDTSFARFGRAFGAGYRERFGADEAVADIAEIVRAGDADTVRVRPIRAQDPAALNLKIYVRGGPLPLSSVFPILENLGLFVESETPYRVRPAGGPDIVIHDIAARSADGAPLSFDAVEAALADAFAAIWTGRADNDGFNRLILKLGVSWREAALMRALARWRQQTGLDPSSRVQEDALAAHPEIVRLVLGLFRVRFDPDIPETTAERAAWGGQLEKQIDAALDKVASLDADRALRRIARLVSAIQRTNFYQTDADGAPKAYMSFKIDSRAVADLVEPKPYREIWVWSPEVEGVHLRFGPVARGGLRWSDRRDDFRTEVLELVKAQQVKNAIIVPVGAKGGFFPKRLPARGAPGFAEAGVSAYKTFLRGLLDITDNIADAGIAPPARVVRWDGDDPYLVVAADKGTATFSDTANGLAAEYGFWLGDAFASGGSVGYDHKAMGITARGAWEAVKRHFRETGVDIQTTPFTVIGVGDMSGDVFGNGMLLSRKIRLLAAFDHRDIFIDPNPADCEAAWTERKRLYDKPGSRWADYDRALISPGGGVWSRSDKLIPLSPDIRALTGLAAEQATPADLMNALLKSPCDLLWFGGIGNYVKAARESHADAGDKANDALRVDAEEVRAKVIGEGANLGVTQAGRVAYARAGGRINTDAVDNSAGVDTSDHEVNIKILLDAAMRTGALPRAQREPLLAQMTDEVGELVLRDNYDQTLALTLAEASAPADLDAHERLIERLERTGKLSRKVEGLPSAEQIRALRDQGLGLTRPELSKLIAYAKIDLFDQLVASPLPDDPHFFATLKAYFPAPLHGLTEAMRSHRLRREIIATSLAGDIVDLGGPTFVERVRETARASAPAIAAAFEAGRCIFALDALSADINALDAAVPATTQTELHLELAAALRRITIYLARRRADAPVADTIAAYRDAVEAQSAAAWETLTPLERHRAAGRAQRFTSAGAPEDLARRVGALSPLVSALDVADLAAKLGRAPLDAARVYRAVGETLGLDRLRAAALALRPDQHWERLALRRTLEELFEDQRVIAEAAARAPAVGGDAKAVGAWIEGLGPLAAAPRATLAELETGGAWTFAKTVIAAAEVRGLASRLAG
ncbi:MAG: NAD-glutamate dehydrogenase [Alphaproteobacteria bacterium]|nr:NAD-glutamate dehydrogenase [Alphaproteobacteria bacterium]